MEAEREVFTEHFTELVTCVRNSVLQITNECFTKKLITDSTQKRLLEGSSDESRKATDLLNAVKDSMDLQKDSFKKFLKILESQGIFADLVGKLKESLDRKQHTTECTDAEGVQSDKAFPVIPIKPVSTAESNKAIRKRVIKKYLREMRSCVQGLIAPIGSSSVTKQLISKAAYQRIIKPSRPVEQRTHCLLLTICKRVRNDTRKFDAFLEILDSHRTCKDVVKTVREEIRRSKEDKLLASSAPVSQETGLGNTNPPPRPPENRNGPIADASGSIDKSKIVYGSGATSDVRVCAPKVNPEKESEYYLKQDKEQDKAFMLAFIERSETKQACLSSEISKLEEEKRQTNQELLEKENKLLDLGVERDDLQLAVDGMRLRVAQMEKEVAKQGGAQHLEKRISELEKEIAEVNREKKVLREQLSDLSNELAAMQMSRNESTRILVKTQNTLHETQTTLEETRTTLKDTQLALKANSKLFFASFIIIIAVIVCLLLCALR